MFHTLAGYCLHWQFAANGRPLQQGEIDPALYAATPPGGEADFSLKAPAPLPQGEEVTLTFTWLLAESTPWAAAGHETAFSQFVLQPAAPPRFFEGPAPALENHGGDIVVAGPGFTCRFCRGRLTAYLVNGKNLLVAPLLPNHHRALTDNDRGYANFVPLLARFLPNFKWVRGAAKFHPTRIRAVRLENAVQVTVHWRHPLCKQTTTLYTIRGDGSLEIRHTTVSKRLPMLRAGLQLGLGPLFQRAEWYGRGPHENYCDRKAGARLGLFEGSLESLEHRYMRPQENGTRSDVRSLYLAGEGETALRFTDLSGNGFYFSAWPYTQEALQKATHLHTLPNAGYCTVNVAGAMCGVGGDLPGVAALHPPYILPPRTEQVTHVLLQPVAARPGGKEKKED
ncbi:MAG: beta-galactosidase small subunit family protein [Oscillospiraceae bacterium]